MRTVMVFLFTGLSWFMSNGQLLPSIGLGALPADTDSICPIAVYSGTYAASGYQVGDTVPDFTLYDKSGIQFNLGNSLSGGKPVLIIAGSVTCPVFRGKINTINNIAAFYAGMLDVVVVYTVEAHPIVDVSPYSGTVWVPSANYTDNVLFEQAKTYGERKSVVDSMLAKYSINVPVLIDGPCNAWWANYGPAPNNAYLVKPDGTVAAKHPWFSKAPDNMYCDLDSLLGTSSGFCTSFGNNGTFSFKLDADSADTGFPGQTLSVHCTLKNLSSSQNAVIDIVKKQLSLPAGWTTALCADVCYAPTVDSIRITLAPSDTLAFIFYFYTDAAPDSGWVRAVFRNAYVQGNRHGQGFYGYTTGAVAINESEPDGEVSLFPVPASEVLYINAGMPLFTKSFVQVFNAAGKSVLAREFVDGDNLSVDVSSLSQGMYVLEWRRENAVTRRPFMVAR